MTAFHRVQTGHSFKLTLAMYKGRETWEGMLGLETVIFFFFSSVIS